MIFGILQDCFVLNALVNLCIEYIYSRVAPPSDKARCFTVRIEKPAKPLYSNAHNLVTARLIVASPSPPMTSHPGKERGQGHVTHLEFYTP